MRKIVAAGVLLFSGCVTSEREPPQTAFCADAIAHCRCRTPYSLGTNAPDMITCWAYEPDREEWCFATDDVLACFGCSPLQRIDDCLR